MRWGGGSRSDHSSRSTGASSTVHARSRSRSVWSSTIMDSQSPGPPLALRTEEGRAVHEVLTNDRRPASPAGQALTAVGVQAPVEIPRLHTFVTLMYGKSLGRPFPQVSSISAGHGSIFKGPALLPIGHEHSTIMTLNGHAAGGQTVPAVTPASVPPWVSRRRCLRDAPSEHRRTLPLSTLHLRWDAKAVKERVAMLSRIRDAP